MAKNPACVNELRSEIGSGGLTRLQCGVDYMWVELPQSCVSNRSIGLISITWIVFLKIDPARIRRCQPSGSLTSLINLIATHDNDDSMIDEHSPYQNLDHYQD